MVDIVFSSTELKVIQNVGDFQGVDELTKLLNKSKVQTYRALSALRKKGVLEGNNIAQLPYLKKLILLIKKYPKLIRVLRGTGIPVLLELREPKKVEEIASNVQLSEQLVYKTIQRAREQSLVSKMGRKYSLNRGVWPDVVAFFDDLFEQVMSFDERIPRDSVIYYKTCKGLLFSNKRELDATPTAFSVFDEYGVKLYPITNYYYLPKKKLSKQDVFNHALVVVKKEFEEKNEYDVRSLIFIALFFLKNNVRSDNGIVKDLIKVISGRKIEGYPSREELKEKAAVYGVELP